MNYLLKSWTLKSGWLLSFSETILINFELTNMIGGSSPYIEYGAWNGTSLVDSVRLNFTLTDGSYYSPEIEYT